VWKCPELPPPTHTRRSCPLLFPPHHTTIGHLVGGWIPSSYGVTEHCVSDISCVLDGREWYSCQEVLATGT
jgi:hypothetical protein